MSSSKAKKKKKVTQSSPLSLWGESKTSSAFQVAHLLLDLTGDLLLNLGGIVLPQHFELLPRLRPLLRPLHPGRRHAQIEADAPDVELGPLPAFGPRPGTHFHFKLEDGERSRVQI